MYDSGMSLEAIADLVGHAGTTITEKVYRHQLRPALVNAAVAMDRIFPARGTGQRARAGAQVVARNAKEAVTCQAASESQRQGWLGELYEKFMIDSRTCRRGTLPISVRGSSATAMMRRGAL